MTTKKDNISHWDNIYATKEIATVSWYQEYPLQSIEMIKGSNLKRDAHIIDVGTGTSRLIPELIANNFVNITGLDISENALKISKMQLGEKSKKINWINSNILTAKLPSKFFTLWHDRATMHFLTNKEDISNYKKKIFESLKPNGYILIMAFEKNGPDKCSGLTVKKYSINSLSKEFKNFDLVTPNEREARFALGDQDSGLRPLASSLYDQANCKLLILKLGDRI